MKRLTAFILTLSLLTGGVMISVSASELPYTDIKKSAWYYNDVKYVTDNGIMNGVSITHFEAQATLSRAMAVTILYRMAKGSVPEGTENPFSDVKNGKWYTDAVLWAYGCGIVKGKTETTFEPNTNINRAEFTVLLSRYAYYADLELKEIRENANFYDSSITPRFAVTAEKLMYRSGVINGFPDNRFMHYQTITRAEAAAMIHRFNEAAEPLDKDAYTDVVFMGNSITVSGHSPEHFAALAEGTDIKVHNISSSGNYLAHHLEDLQNEYMSPYVNTVEEAEIVILQEYGGGLPIVGEDEELAELRMMMNHPGVLFASGDSITRLIMTYLGHDKTYYSYTANLPSGPMKSETFTDWNGRVRNNDNEAILKIKEILLERYALDHIYVANLAFSHPELGITWQELYPDQVHPTHLMGYVIALTLYCDMFDLQATEQNDGALEASDIPGGTAEEKAQFMVKLKTSVQEIIDIQKLDK